uniref:Formiminotransferase N-terminal subdomain domain-containing protein n=1 Tax=Leptobrachium leishanense TaxID=445787 RepID=A0A8C5QLQ5_9ANUR
MLHSQSQTWGTWGSEKMASRRLGLGLVACLLNVSEGRRKDVVEQIARAALQDKHGRKQHNTSVLNIFSDYDYNRSVITIASTAEQIGRSVTLACLEGFACIDLSQHSGIHPCLGAIDLIPIYPLSNIKPEECGRIAQVIAGELATLVPGCSMFLFGHADEKTKKSQAEKRRSLGWFKRNTKVDVTQLKADVGANPSKRYGLTGVGASSYVMNCNVTLDTQDVTTGRSIANVIRCHLDGVQAMAFPHCGQVEIACNIQSFRDSECPNFTPESDKYVLYNICSDTYSYVSPRYLEGQVRCLAKSQDIDTVGAALVGFSPQECKDTAEHAIDHGIGEFWKKRSNISM